MFTTREEFFDTIRSTSTDDLLEEWLFGGSRPHAFATDVEQSAFYDSIRSDWGATEHISLAGTGAWRYSLNPKKNFQEFSGSSDVDVVNISDNHFHETWNHLRQHHRSAWYVVDNKSRQALLRTGENVYSGFVSPKWIPDKGNSFRFDFETRLEKYATKAIGYRTVNMVFFRNREI